MTRLFVISVVTAGLLAPAEPGLAQSCTTDPVICRAQALADSGKFEQAISLYSQILGSSHHNWNNHLEAATLYGRAIAVQRWVEGDSAATDRIPAAVDDYLLSRTTDSASYFAASSNNAAILLRRTNDHRRALGLFLDASTTQHPARPYFFLEAGREYERLERPDSAAAMYRRALDLDGRNSDALDALLTLLATRRDYSGFVGVAAQNLGEGTDPGILSSALITGMTLRRGAIADSCVVLFANQLALTRTSPFFFMSTYKARLDSVARVQPELAEPLRDLMSAYYPLQGGPYLGGEMPRWWRQTLSRRAAWSTTLRALGDWHRNADREISAQSLYEAALGYPHPSFDDPAVDLDAALPLLLIYLHRADSDRNRQQLLSQVDNVTEALFVGKRQAYLNDDLDRIRRFHTTLGVVFAEEQRWPDAVNQLERLRNITARLSEQRHVALTDPPEVLQRLQQAYEATGRSREAIALGREIDLMVRRNRDVITPISDNRNELVNRSGVSRQDLARAYETLLAASRDDGPCTNRATCSRTPTTAVISPTWNDGTSAVIPRVVRGIMSPHDAIVQAGGALRSGDRNLALAWVLSTQIDRSDRAAFEWLAAHPDAVIVVLKECLDTAAGCNR